jgi:hypothetical protein
MHARDLLNARMCSFRCDFGKNLASLSKQFAGSVNHRFEFHKHRQLFIRTHNKALSIVVVCVCDPDRAPFNDLLRLPLFEIALVSVRLDLL